MPDPGSDKWQKLEARPLWRPSVHDGGYGRADPVEQGYQVVYPKDLRARYIKAPGADRLIYYDKNIRRSSVPVRLEVDDIDNDKKPDIFAASDVWPIFTHRHQQQEQLWAVLRPDGSEISRHDAPVSVQAVCLLDIDSSGRKHIVQAGIGARIEIFQPGGKLIKQIDLHRMHQKFNQTEGRPNMVKPPGGYTMPYCLGMWRPGPDGRKKMIISRYGGLSFVDQESRFEGLLLAGGYVSPAMFKHGIDFNGDGLEEQLSLSYSGFAHIDGGETPTVRDPSGDIFYPQVYQAKTARG